LKRAAARGIITGVTTTSSENAKDRPKDVADNTAKDSGWDCVTLPPFNVAGRICFQWKNVDSTSGEIIFVRLRSAYCILHGFVGKNTV